MLSNCYNQDNNLQVTGLTQGVNHFPLAGGGVFSQGCKGRLSRDCCLQVFHRSFLYRQTFIFRFDRFSFLSSSLSKNQVVEEEEERTFYQNRRVKINLVLIHIPLMAYSYSGGFWPIRGVKRKYAIRKITNVSNTVLQRTGCLFHEVGTYGTRLNTENTARIFIETGWQICGQMIPGFPPELFRKFSPATV